MSPGTPLALSTDTACGDKSNLQMPGSRVITEMISVSLTCQATSCKIESLVRGGVLSAISRGRPTRRTKSMMIARRANPLRIGSSLEHSCIVFIHPLAEYPVPRDTKYSKVSPGAIQRKPKPKARPASAKLRHVIPKEIQGRFRPQAEIPQNRKGSAKQRRAATQPTFSTTVLVSCYESTLLRRGQAAVDEAAPP